MQAAKSMHKISRKNNDVWRFYWNKKEGKQKLFAETQISDATRASRSRLGYVSAVIIHIAPTIMIDSISSSILDHDHDASVRKRDEADTYSSSDVMRDSSLLVLICVSLLDTYIYIKESPKRTGSYNEWSTLQSGCYHVSRIKYRIIMIRSGSTGQEQCAIIRVLEEERYSSSKQGFAQYIRGQDMFIRDIVSLLARVRVHVSCIIRKYACTCMRVRVSVYV